MFEKVSLRRFFVILLVIACLVIFISPLGQFVVLSEIAKPILSSTKDTTISNDYSGNNLIVLPKIVHQMWKDDKIPFELNRWKNGCKKLNPDFEFKIYSDEELKRFVHLYYPEYLDIFNSLHGVYMADMARILLVYHFGGIYMDLDFYCRRPFHCLYQSLLSTYITSSVNNILAVPLEPQVHAVLFRNKKRVVIQDFYLSTPRHPFLKWFLDDRNEQYFRTKPNSIKGPFSYSIEKDIDRYHIFLQQRAATQPIHAQTNFSVGHIVELDEHILHPLIDQTNSKLYSVCQKVKDSHNFISNEKNDSLNIAYTKSCQVVNQHNFFRSKKETVAVHMWSHVYLGWNFIRMLYNSRLYRLVESALPPTFSCNS